MSTPTNDYWRLIDEAAFTKTYKHRLGHGTLIRVSTITSGRSAESIVFIPDDPAGRDKTAERTR